MKIGILGAMPQEIQTIVGFVEDAERKEIGMREFVQGTIDDIEVVVVYSRCGKVAAAGTIAILILEFGVTHVIFTGAAGAIHPDLNIGDIVIADRLIQHDMDGSPVVPQYEIPLLGMSFFDSNPNLSEFAYQSAGEYFDAHHSNTYLHALGSDNPKVMRGDIATGDKFIKVQSDKDRLLEAIPTILCVEMEGGAVAQVCYEFGIPFTIIRIISDSADHNAEVDFFKFIDEVLVEMSPEIIKGLVGKIHEGSLVS